MLFEDTSGLVGYRKQLDGFNASYVEKKDAEAFLGAGRESVYAIGTICTG
jgi:hypothetical protein